MMTDHEYHQRFSEAMALLYNAASMIRKHPLRFLGPNYAADKIAEERTSCIADYSSSLESLSPMPSFGREFILFLEDATAEINSAVMDRMGLHASDSAAYDRIMINVRRIEARREDMMFVAERMKAGMRVEEFSHGW